RTQPAREVLPPHGRRKEAAHRVARVLVAVRRRRRQSARDFTVRLTRALRMQDPQEAPAPRAQLADKWRRYLRFWGPRADADVDDELQFHFEMRVRDYMARGMSDAEARAAVFHRLGNVGAIRAQCVAITARRHRRMTRAQIVDALVQDIRFAFRTLGR